MADAEDYSAVPANNAAVVCDAIDFSDADVPSIVLNFCLKLYELKKNLNASYDMFMIGFREALQVINGGKECDESICKGLSDMCSLLNSQVFCEQLFATKATQDQRVFVYKLLVMLHFSVLPEEKIGKTVCDESLEEAAKFLRLVIGMTGAFEVRQFLWQVLFKRFGKKYPKSVTRLYELLNLPVPKQLKKHARCQLDEGDEELDSGVMVRVLSSSSLKLDKKKSEESTIGQVKVPSSQGRKKAESVIPPSRLKRSASMFVDPTQPVLIGLNSSCHKEITKNLTKCKKGKHDVMPFTKHVSFNVQYLSPSTAKFAEELDKSLSGKVESQSPKSPEVMSPNPYKTPKTPVKTVDGIDLSNFITGHCPVSGFNVTPDKTNTPSQNKFVTPLKNSTPVDALSSPEVPSPNLPCKSSKKTLAPATPLFKQKLPSKTRSQLCTQPVQTILETPPEKLAKHSCDVKGRRAVAMRLFAQL
ncbi:hypothetical protein M514_00785 [Trichuris suis]|uniref:Uncharacterized protein n=1 Tax=Trichuris suis TaxID=68888 RepID=A0A085N9B9_9BILA|nr:hypothetical protein M513_00785 [Trichuris suis]KFD66065.1 hypothetical protein M514_00785 [Trichuris suis]